MAHVKLVISFLLSVIFWPIAILPILAGESESEANYLFNLGGLSKEQIESINPIPGVLSSKTIDNRVQIHWRYWLPKAQPGTEDEWIANSLDGIYSLLVLKQKLGNTKWVRGGPAGNRSDTVMELVSPRTRITFGFHFRDIATGQINTMKLHCFCEADKKQVQHEMLRDVVGTQVNVEKCGSGFALVSNGERGEFVVWQVSSQMFVRIDDLFDRDMVAGYIERLGCITPKEFTIDQNLWIENEIRWRIKQLNQQFLKRKEAPHQECLSHTIVAWVQSTFPDLPVKINRDLKLDCTIEQEWQHLNIVRHWLWANRLNLAYDDKSRGFKLKDQDRFEPDHMVELPEELRGPEAPNSEDNSKQIQDTKLPEENQNPSPDPRANVRQ